MNPFERSAAAAVVAKNGAKTAKSVTKKTSCIVRPSRFVD